MASQDDGKRVPLDVKTGNSILSASAPGEEIKLDRDEYLSNPGRGQKKSGRNSPSPRRMRGRSSAIRCADGLIPGMCEAVPIVEITS